MMIEHRELQFKGVVNVSHKPCPHVLLQIQFEIHDNSEMMRIGVHVVELGMSSIVLLQANPCLSRSQMCCLQSMCLPSEQQPWAAANHSALLTDMMVALQHVESSHLKKTHTLSHMCRRAHTVICTQMHAQMHMQWYKWDFSLGGTFEHEQNHLFLRWLCSPALLKLSFFLIYFYIHECIILHML